MNEPELKEELLKLLKEKAVVKGQMTQIRLWKEVFNSAKSQVTSTG